MRGALRGGRSPAWFAWAVLVFSLVALDPAAARADPGPGDGPRVTAIDGRIELGQSIYVEVTGLAAWMADPAHQAKQLVPYINGRELMGTRPEQIQKDGLYFHLAINETSRDVWDDLLRRPRLRRPVTFSVGLPNQAAFATVFDKDNQVPLVIIPPIWGLSSLVVLFASGLLFVLLAGRTNLLRDLATVDETGGLRPYNLGRVQMAFWSFLIAASYTVIWLITGNLDTIPGSVLMLLGISAATALSDAAIDVNRANKAAAEARATAHGDDPADAAASARADTDTTAAPPAADAGLTVHTTARAVPSMSSIQRVSGGFFRDILSDAGGYSFDRFQVVIWTATLGLIFVGSVYNNLSMPEFSNSILALMGISSGTYIGFKFPEKSK